MFASYHRPVSERAASRRLPVDCQRRTLGIAGDIHESDQTRTDLSEPLDDLRGNSLLVELVGGIGPDQQGEVRFRLLGAAERDLGLRAKVEGAAEEREGRFIRGSRLAEGRQCLRQLPDRRIELQLAEKTLSFGQHGRGRLGRVFLRGRWARQKQKAERDHHGASRNHRRREKRSEEMTFHRSRTIRPVRRSAR